MLLGANGQNVYPEEIEDKLVTLPLVSECVVIQKGEKFYALVYPDPDKIRTLGLARADVEAIMEQNRKDLNQIIPVYCSISGIRLMCSLPLLDSKSTSWLPNANSRILSVEPPKIKFTTVR